MRWRRAAIAVCATVATLAGAVGVTASAVAADREPPRPAASTGESSATAGGASSPYRSSVTITLDRTTASCGSSSDGSPNANPRPVPCAGVVRLPVGSTEPDVIRALGEPQRRRTVGAGGEEWDYTGHLDEEHDAVSMTTVRFDGHRLVDATEYIVK